MNDTVDVAWCCKTVMGMQEGVFLTKSERKNQKQRHKCQILDSPNCETLIHLVLQEPFWGEDR